MNRALLQAESSAHVQRNVNARLLEQTAIADARIQRALGRVKDLKVCTHSYQF